MIRRLAWLAAVVWIAGCAIGPRYRPAPVIAPNSQISGAYRDSSTRSFFDSLEVARRSDTLGVAGPPPQPPHILHADSLTDLAWLDVLHDSTLSRLVDLALRRNRDLSVARSRIAEYRAGVGVARAPLFPNLSLNGSASKNRVAFGSVGTLTYPAYRTTADLSWELDFWGQTRRGVQAAQAELEAQRAAERAVVLSLVADVATEYLQLLELDQEHEVAQQTLASRQATLELARQRFGRGLISELDIRQFEAQVAVPAARLAQVEQLRSERQHALDVLLGQGQIEIPRTGSLATVARAVVVPDSIPSTLLARRPDVAVAERQYAAATARIGEADAARLPAFSIVGLYGAQSTTTGDLYTAPSRVYELLGGVSIPIFTGGRLSNEARAARAQAEEARAQYEQSVLVALGEVGDALTAVRAARDQAVALETQSVALRRALDLAELRYSRGLSNYLEVLDAQRSLFEAELASSQAELQQLIATVELYKALGGSWPQPPERR